MSLTIQYYFVQLKFVFLIIKKVFMEGKSIFDSSFNWQEIAIKHLKKTLKSQVY